MWCTPGTSKIDKDKVFAAVWPYVMYVCYMIYVIYMLYTMLCMLYTTYRCYVCYICYMLYICYLSVAPFGSGEFSIFDAPSGLQENVFT